ncbi:MAG: 3-dehydroquinate synthase [Cellulomonadaceae bacterium]|nr:3-dehydroquinate synthase [Cellulomonadaceae bacterium]
MVAFSEFRVASSAGGYDVVVGDGTFAETLADSADDVVVVDAALAALVPARHAPVLTVAADEASKTLAGCEQLILALREAGVRRGDRVLAVGGGIVQDVATFVSDVYMRGLAWRYVPTTLMAMADSCLGGKSSINVGGVKNLVGGIYPPQAVVVDPTFLATLPTSAVAAGLSEAAKIAFCRGPEAFDTYLDHYSQFGASPSALIDHVLQAKRWFVEIDEHDVRERRLLNFGHTFGHALESAVGNRLSHGLAVAAGVLCAIEHPKASRSDLTDALGAHCRALLGSADEVVPALAHFDAERFERAFRSDKKHSAHSFRLILPAVDGGVAEVEVDADDAGWTVVDHVARTTIETLSGRTA